MNITSFACQNPRCKKAVEIDESLLEINIQLLETLEIEAYLVQCEDEATKKEKQPLSSDPQFPSKLFEYANDITGLAHPLCKECSHKQLKLLEAQISEVMKENESYQSYKQRLDAQMKSIPHQQMDTELTNLIEEETKLRENLALIEKEREVLKDEMARLQMEEKAIQEVEDKYWTAFNEFQTELQAFRDEYDTTKMKLANSKMTLDILKVTNVYNDTFHIWHDGHFGTINNFRLGKLPSQPVDWNEINAAWGQATLLLYTVAKKLHYQFSQYRLLPMGSCSKMEKASDKSTYELYGSSDISLGRLFWNRRFDNGMVAFLGCLKDLGAYAEGKEKKFQLPYKIEKDKIGEMSIKIQFNDEETWTKALKYMLTNLKFLVLLCTSTND